MLERLQRDLSHRCLLDGGEHRVPQFTKPGARDTQRGIGGDQRQRDRENVVPRCERVDSLGINERDVDRREF